MSTKFLSLAEAAKLLGVNTDMLNRYREKAYVRAFRDGPTWKFRSDDLESFKSKLAAGELDDLGDSSDSEDVLLVNEQLLAPPGAGSSTVIGKEEKADAGDSDLRIGDFRPDAASPGGSDVRLIPSDAMGAADSDVKLVPDVTVEHDEAHLESHFEIRIDDDSLAIDDSNSNIAKVEESNFDSSFSSSDDDEGIQLADSDSVISAEIPKINKPGVSKSKSPVPDSGSDIGLSSDSADFGVHPLAQGKGHTVDSESSSSSSESVLEDDDIVLRAGGSDITLNPGDSGISLQDAKDSGISLDAPLRLMGDDDDSEALELSGDDMMSIADDSDDSDSMGEVKADSDFLLTPLEEMSEESEDSGSQVIALDDGGFSDSSGSMEAVLEEESPAGFTPAPAPAGFQPMDMGMAAGAAAVPMVPQSPEAQYSILNVLGLASCLLLLSVTGMMMYDLVRNMWSWDQPYQVNSTIMDAILGIIG